MDLTHLSVVPTPGDDPRADDDWPRKNEPDFRPATWLRLAAVRDSDSAGWRLTRLHESGIGLTAEVYRGEAEAGPGGGRRAAVKVLRQSPLANVSRGAAEDRMRREWNTSATVAARVVTTGGVAEVYTPDGRVMPGELPRLDPCGLCLAARHAIEPDPADRSRPNYRRSQACTGCANAARADADCRPWLVRPDTTPFGAESRVIVQRHAGTTLAQWIDEKHSSSRRAGGRSPGRQLAHRVDLIRAIAAAVEALHAAGVWHLDLNPDNVCVEWQGEAIRGCLIDLGQAEAATQRESSATYRERLPAGNPLYAAPEVRFPCSRVWVEPLDRLPPAATGAARFRAALGGMLRPSGWEPVSVGDVISVGYPPNEPGFFARVTGVVPPDGPGRSRYEVSCQTFNDAGQGGRVLDVFGTVHSFPATLHRNPSAGADYYSLGLIALAILAKSQDDFTPELVDELQRLQILMPRGQVFPSPDQVRDLVGAGARRACTLRAIHNTWQARLADEGRGDQTEAVGAVIQLALRLTVRGKRDSFFPSRSACPAGLGGRVTRELGRIADGLRADPRRPPPAPGAAPVGGA